MSAFGGPNIIDDGLVLYLDAGNRKSYPGSGTTWFDKSGRGNNGTLINGPTFNTGSLGSVVFDGVNDYVNCGNSTVLNLVNDLTLSCWVKSTGRSGLYRVIINKNYTNNNPTYEMGISNGNKLYWYGNGVDKYGTTNIQLNTNYHFTITINSLTKTGVLYINGSVESSMSGLATQLANSEPLNVGVDAPTGINEGAFFNGNIYNTSIYNRALSAQEILQNYNATKGRFNL
jgi:hypothetical protein